ncbi:hypothetical protein, partial [Mesorhizobium sp. M1A.F.Ca.IN.022.02.1.1]|uniref:hypothetical protein n=1 Tax=Mesorhizobium sp. M1A.F.Ca.IN.022.02.1.1 TaxID=2496766 RepID=UPI0019D06C41
LYLSRLTELCFRPRPETQLRKPTEIQTRNDGFIASRSRQRWTSRYVIGPYRWRGDKPPELSYKYFRLFPAPATARLFKTNRKDLTWNTARLAVPA